MRRQLDKSYENRFEKVDDLECVPNISQYVETNESIKLAYAHLMKTQLGEDEKPIENSCDPCFQFPLLGMCHQANVCVCCDRFITGTSEVKWINKAVLLCNKDRLQDSELSISLQNCYNVLDVELQHCLLSPRARVNVKDDYMCCSQCYHSLRPHMRDKPPPKFSISNKWAIGNMPSELLELLTEVTGPLISPVRPFAYVMSFTGGAHKSITGSYTFFGNNVEENVGALGHHIGLTGSPSVYIVMSGRFTPSQRTIVRKRCLIEVDNFVKIYNWLRENNPYYEEMPEMSSCPTPMMFEDEPDANNTDESEDLVVESHVDYHYWFPSNGEPTKSTATYHSQEDFMKAYMEGKEPTLVFSSNNNKNDWELCLTQIFPLYFPYGVGKIKEKRKNPVSELECMRHYLRLSLPQFQKADFILVLGHMLFRKQVFRSAFVRCMSKTGEDGITLGEKFSRVTDQEMLLFAEVPNLQEGNAERDTASSMLHTIKASCKSVPYSDEAATVARTKLFALWNHFGPPSIFFTISPADECSFRVQLFCNTNKQGLPSFGVPESECVSSMLFRKQIRTENPGACAREFNSLRDIIMEVLIGWDSKTGKQVRNGIFGIVEAWCDTTEEQGRFTLHSHILLFIKYFDQLMTLLWSENEETKTKAKKELLEYFQKIMCSTYDIAEEELIHEMPITTTTRQQISKTTISLEEVSSDVDKNVGDFATSSICANHCENISQSDLSISHKCRVNPVIMEKQLLRNLRQKESVKFTNGYVAICPKCHKRFTTKDIVWSAVENWYTTAKTEYPEYFGDLTLTFPLSDDRISLLALRFPYDMVNLFSGDSSLKKFIRAICHLHFNEHDWKHRPGCFKKGCECRFDFPRWVQGMFDLIFAEEDSTATWYTIYGSRPDLKASGFSLVSTRGVSDVFMNAHNKAVCTVLGYNNNVSSGGRDMIYYVTLYNTKSNQQEERFPFFKQCVAIAKRMKRINFEENQVAREFDNADDENVAEVEPSYGKGLGHVLSGICAHLSSSIISATMAWHLVINEERFRFSHEFSGIFLSQMEDWLQNQPISFRYRRCSTTKEGWLDSSLMNYLFRPENDGFDNMCAYEFFSEYELRLKSSLANKRNYTDNECGDDEADNDQQPEDVSYSVNWDFLAEHPGKSFACLKKMKKVKIPMLYYKGELPDLEDCKIWDKSEELPPSVTDARNKYATTMLLLFYSFRDTCLFLDLEESRWDFFCRAVDTRDPLLYIDSARIMQNIQNLHNSKKFVKPKDTLLIETELLRMQKELHLNRDETNENNDDESSDQDQSDTNLIIEEYAYFRNELESNENNKICTNTTSKFDSKNLSSKDNIANGNILKHNNFNIDTTVEGDVANGPSKTNTFTKENFIQVILDFDKPITPADEGKKWTFDRIDPSSEKDPKCVIDRLDACAVTYKLDDYQKASFDIICSSFMMSYLEKSKSSHLPNYQEAISRLEARGAQKQLIMFLSGAGGCGKSHVIGVARAMCQHFCRSINQGFDSSSFLLTASTNSAAALIGGFTIHSVAQLRTKFDNVTINGKDIKITWVTANLIIIDEISMLSLEDFNKLDKHLRKLMREATRKESNLPFGGLHIVLCGDFFQLNPVLAIPIYNRKKNVLWHLINKVIFLKGYNHRFENDVKWGELLDRLRLGILTEDDYNFLDTRVVGPNLSLPLVQNVNLSYACPTNSQRNRITENNFEDMLRKTHPPRGSSEKPPENTVIIKGIFRGKKGGSEKTNQFHRLIYNNCGDDNIVMAGGSGRVDPCLKLSYGCPLMVSEFKDVERGIVKGVTGRFVGVVLKSGCSFEVEIWGGFRINTIRSDEVEYIICERTKKEETDKTKHFILKPKKFSVNAKIPVTGGNFLTLSELELFQFPVNLDEATTGHKLQGTTKSILAIADHNYLGNWIYVAYSRVRTSCGLFLLKKLNRKKKIGPTDALLREIETLEIIEQETLRQLQKNGYFPMDVDITKGVTSAIRASKNRTPGTRPTGESTVIPEHRIVPFNLDSFLLCNNMRRITGTEFSFTTGNCLFDSVSFLLPTWKGNGKGLRQAAIDWSKEEYISGKSEWCEHAKSHFIDTSIDNDSYGKSTYLEYLTFLESPFVYATELDVNMISNFLQVGIIIYSNSEHPNNVYRGSFEKTIYLFYDEMLLHYEPIIDHI